MATAKKARSTKKTASPVTSAPEQTVTATAPSNGQTHSNGKSSSVVNIDEAIRQRAYEIYEQRGRLDGNAMEDWLRAEAEVREQESA